MKHYAVLDRDFLITNIIVASSLEVAESATSSSCVLVPAESYAKIGWSYIDGMFVDPDAPTEETPA
jgi:hypothetical protein